MPSSAAPRGPPVAPTAFGRREACSIEAATPIIAKGAASFLADASARFEPGFARSLGLRTGTDGEAPSSIDSCDKAMLPFAIDHRAQDIPPMREMGVQPSCPRRSRTDVATSLRGTRRRQDNPRRRRSTSRGGSAGPARSSVGAAPLRVQGPLPAPVTVPCPPFGDQFLVPPRDAEQPLASAARGTGWPASTLTGPYEFSWYFVQSATPETATSAQRAPPTALLAHLRV